MSNLGAIGSGFGAAVEGFFKGAEMRANFDKMKKLKELEGERDSLIESFRNEIMGKGKPTEVNAIAPTVSVDVPMIGQPQQGSRQMIAPGQ